MAEIEAEPNAHNYKESRLHVYSSVIEKHRLDLQQLVDEEERSEAEFVGAMETRAHRLHVDYVHDVNLAVLGERGVGKSSLVNAFTGAHARTAVVECTRDLMAYSPPELPHLKVWDVPGYGTQKTTQKVDTYLESFCLFYMDYLCLLVGDHLSETDIHLATLCKEFGLPFCLLRSKADSDIENACVQKHGRGYGELGGLERAEVVQQYSTRTHAYMVAEQARAHLEDVDFFLLSAPRCTQLRDACDPRMKNRAVPTVDEADFVDVIVAEIVNTRAEHS